MLAGLKKSPINSLCRTEMQNVNRAFDGSEEVGWKTEVPELWPLFCYKIGKMHVGVDLRDADIVPLNISSSSFNLTERQVLQVVWPEWGLEPWDSESGCWRAFEI